MNTKIDYEQLEDLLSRAMVTVLPNQTQTEVLLWRMSLSMKALIEENKQLREQSYTFQCLQHLTDEINRLKQQTHAKDFAAA